MGTRCNDSMAQAIRAAKETFRSGVPEYELRVSPAITAGWDFSSVDEPMELTKVVSYGSGWRSVTRPGGGALWCRKTRHAWHPVRGRVGKFTVSSEEEQEGPPDSPGAVTLVRLRARKSFKHPYLSCRVDITDTWSGASEKDIDHTAPPITELELEWIGPSKTTAVEIQSQMEAGYMWAKRRFNTLK